MKVLFLIRDKMGDSLIAANVALLFARRYPEHSVTVMTRSAYAYPLAGEPEIDLVAYRNGAHAMLVALWWRMTGKRFDVVGVLRGFGKRTRNLLGLIPSRVVVVENEALRAAATRVVAPMPPDFPLYGPSASVAREISPDFAEPRTMSFPRLAQRWRETPKKYVVLFPMSDEPRKNMPADEVEALYRLLKERHADKEVLVLVRNRREVAMFSRTPQVPLTTFHDVPTLGRFFLQSAAYYGVDTGPMHLALGMGMPCTVFFGPTQPHRVIPVEQADVVALREAVLGRRHCDVTSCTRPVCISRTVARFVGREAKEEELLAACPLRAAPVRK